MALEQTYIFTRLESTSSGGAPYAGKIFSNHIARVKLSLQATRELSLRAILDYSTTAADPQLTTIESGTRTVADLLATFQINPWTALYLGYTAGLEDIGDDLGHQLGLRRTVGLYRTARQLFAKASYVVRF